MFSFSESQREEDKSNLFPPVGKEFYFYFSKIAVLPFCWESAIKLDEEQKELVNHHLIYLVHNIIKFEENMRINIKQME